MTDENHLTADAAVLDTSQIAKTLIQQGLVPNSGGMKLGTLVKRLGLAKYQMHIGGNDAYLTLRLLFMLAYNSVDVRTLVSFHCLLRSTPHADYLKRHHTSSE